MLEKKGLWNEEVKKAIIINEDPSRASISVEDSEALPDSLGPEAEFSYSTQGQELLMYVSPRA
jgi:hypothetical protein